MADRRNAGRPFLCIAIAEIWRATAIVLIMIVAGMYGGRNNRIGPPLDVYARAQTRFVGGFIGTPPMNFVKLDARNGAITLGGATFASPISNSPVERGLRGEDAHIASNTLTAIPVDGRRLRRP